MRPKTLCVLVLLILAAGCSGHETPPEPASRLTEHQRDSVLAKSDLPGARVAGGAIGASDDATERAAHMDATLDSLTK